MCLKPQPVGPVPERTAQVAKAAFLNGSPALRIRDELGSLYEDAAFAALYPLRGQPGLAPWRLALVTVLQFAEGLSDRQAAEAVRGRIDWKYALGLELDDPGFDFSVLCEFRSRLIVGGGADLLLDEMLRRLAVRGLVRPRGRQRTDSTHVLAAVRALNRLESLGETLRAALNAVAVAAPEWLAGLAAPEWYERYAKRVEQYRLPRGETARRDLAETIDADGHRLLAAAWSPEAPAELTGLPAIEVLRRAWVHHFHLDAAGRVTLRDRTELPPAGVRCDGPYDTEARFGNKRSLTWSGYKAHLTETCDDDLPHVIVHVETTPGHEADVHMTARVHSATAAKELTPATHFVDAGYVDAELLLASRDAGIDLVGPVRPNVSWQAREGGYDVSAFTVDWQQRTVTCPQGEQNTDWHGSSCATPGATRWFISASRQALVALARHGRCARGRRPRPAN